MVRGRGADNRGEPVKRPAAIVVAAVAGVAAYFVTVPGTALPGTSRAMAFDYPASELASVRFWVEETTNLAGEIEWRTNATIQIDLPTTNAAGFYRVGVDWR